MAMLDNDCSGTSTKWKVAEPVRWEMTFLVFVYELTRVLDDANTYFCSGFDSLGNVVNKPDHGTLDWVKICEKSAKVITFIDLAGHERYLKTTVFGMTGHAPDFGMLMVC